MAQPPVPDRILILSGAGLSKASGVPTFRDHDGLWQGHRFEDLATPEAWAADRDRVRAFYDARRIACAAVAPNPGHRALARLQRALGTDRVVLVTQNVDGLLDRAGAPDVIEMHGSLWRLRCEADPRHPRVPVEGAQDPEARCARCGARLRPDVVWFGEMPVHMDRIELALSRCDTFVAVGTSGVVYPAAGFAALARARGARCVEINPQPSGGRFDEVIPRGAETALPDLVAGWLGG